MGWGDMINLMQGVAIDLEVLAREKTDALKSGELLSQHATDFLDEEGINQLQVVLSNYYNKFCDYLELTYSWKDISFLLQLAGQPLSLFNDVGGHVWSIGFEDLHPLSKHIIEIEIQNFIEEIKQKVWYHSETKDRLTDSDWNDFADDSVLFTSDLMMERIKKRLEVLESLTKDKNYYKANPVSWSDALLDHASILLLHSSGKLDKLEFYLKIKTLFVSENFQWRLDFSTFGVIRQVPRESKIIYEWLENELDKLKPRFLVINTEYKLKRNHKEVFYQKWEKIINDGIVEIAPLNNFIISNFIFDTEVTSIEKLPYTFKPIRGENLKQAVHDIIEIFDKHKIFQRTSKREVALWIYFHFRNSVEYSSIEYYVYHK